MDLAADLSFKADIDAGLASATQQFMARALGQGDRARAGRVLATSLPWLVLTPTYWKLRRIWLRACSR